MVVALVEVVVVGEVVMVVTEVVVDVSLSVIGSSWEARDCFLGAALDLWNRLLFLAIKLATCRCRLSSARALLVVLNLLRRNNINFTTFDFLSISARDLSS